MSRAETHTFAYRANLFTPAQAGECTGLSPAMQRNWRQAGHLDPRTTGVALFDPHDLAVIRLMVVLRDVGLGPALSRSISEEAAPSVIWWVLADHPQTWVIAGPSQEAAAYRQHLELLGDQHLQEMARLNGSPAIYGISQGKSVQWVSTLSDTMFDDGDEVESVIKLPAIASRIADAVTQPLFTIQAPSPAKL